MDIEGLEWREAGGFVFLARCDSNPDIPEWVMTLTEACQQWRGREVEMPSTHLAFSLVWLCLFSERAAESAEKARELLSMHPLAAWQVTAVYSFAGRLSDDIAVRHVMELLPKKTKWPGVHCSVLSARLYIGSALYRLGVALYRLGSMAGQRCILADLCRLGSISARLYMGSALYRLGSQSAFVWVCRWAHKTKGTSLPQAEHGACSGACTACIHKRPRQGASCRH